MDDAFRSQGDRSPSAAEEAAVVMRALSNPARLSILNRLVGCECTVSELETELALPQAYVSQQLARLRDDGLVAATRDGRHMRYQIADPRVVTILSALHDAFGPVQVGGGDTKPAE